MQSLAIVLLFCSNLSRASRQQEYCKISQQHTLCTNKGIGGECGIGANSRDVTEDEMKIILDIHNKYRARIAQGQERQGTPGPQPQAANMQELVWDPELATIAQMHADQCLFEHDCSDCRKVDRFRVGQNLYIYKQTIRPAPVNWVRAVTSWYEEVSMFSNKKVSPFQFSHETGHYSQLVWAATTQVGCGATSFKEGRWFSTLYTCNYGPGGNIIRGQMYRQGRACSACQDNCSLQYPGLCSTSNNTTAWKPSRPKRMPQSSPSNIQSSSLHIQSLPTHIQSLPTHIQSSPSHIQSSPSHIQSSPSHSQSSPKHILRCNFESEDESCHIRTSGAIWSKNISSSSNTFYQVRIRQGGDTQLFFSHLLPPPANNIACVSFRYRKHSTDGASQPLHLISWPFKASPVVVSLIKDSPHPSSWLRANIVLRNLDRQFLLMLRAEAGASSLYITMDDVQVGEGKCKNNQKRRRRRRSDRSSRRWKTM